MQNIYIYICIYVYTVYIYNHIYVWKLIGLMLVKQCHKPPIWSDCLYCLYHLSMGKMGMVYYCFTSITAIICNYTSRNNRQHPKSMLFDNKTLTRKPLQKETWWTVVFFSRQAVILGKIRTTHFLQAVNHTHRIHVCYILW